MREMKDSGVDWIGEIPHDWEIVQTKRVFRSIKRVVGNQVSEYERLALTLMALLNVVKRIMKVCNQKNSKDIRF